MALLVTPKPVSTKEPDLNSTGFASGAIDRIIAALKQTDKEVDRPSLAGMLIELRRKLGQYELLPSKRSLKEMVEHSNSLKKKLTAAHQILDGKASEQFVEFLTSVSRQILRDKSPIRDVPFTEDQSDNVQSLVENWNSSTRNILELLSDITKKSKTSSREKDRWFSDAIYIDEDYAINLFRPKTTPETYFIAFDLYDFCEYFFPHQERYRNTPAFEAHPNPVRLAVAALIELGVTNPKSRTQRGVKNPKRRPKDPRGKGRSYSHDEIVAIWLSRRPPKPRETKHD